MGKNIKEQSGLFFVQITEPDLVRRNILESLKQILELLQGFEKFKQIRHEKTNKIQKLRTLVRHTNKMMAELKSKMPQTSLRVAVQKQPRNPVKEITHKKKEMIKSKVPKKETTELERLQSELSAIESKLKNFM